MAGVTLYGAFRRHIDDWRQEVDAATVGDALNSLTADNAALRDAVFDPGGGLRQFVRVMVNGRDIELLDGLETPLGAEDEMSVFSPSAGG